MTDPRGTPDPLTRRLRLFTYNAYESRPGIEPLRRILAELDPDIICLQEMVLGSTRTTEFDQPAWLAERLGRSHVTMRTCHGYYRNVGTAVLTREPFELNEVFRDPRGLPYAITGHARVGGGRIALAACHLERVPRPLPFGILVSWFDRTAQLRRICRWIERTGSPGLIAGDFNALPYSPDYLTIARRMSDCSRVAPANHRATRPTWGLPMQVDYAFATRHFRVSRWETLDYGASDHRPAFVDLALSTGAGEATAGAAPPG